MITTLHADNALKTIYLDVLSELLSTKINPLLTQIEQTSSDVWGKEIRTVAYEQEHLPLYSVLKNLIVQVEFPDKAIKAASGYMGSFTDILNSSIEECLSTAREDLGQILYSDGANSKELTGIGSIFDTSKPLYGQNRDISPIMQPLIKEVSDFTDISIEKAIDELCDRGGNVNFIAVSRDVKYAYMEQHKNIDIVELDDGFKALSYHGIPIVYDRFVPRGTMYLLDTSAFKLHQLCDWRWLETENGKILRQNQDKPTYTATLVKYGDLICHRPDRQGMIKFTELQ